MAADRVKNLAASVRQRLLNVAKKRGDDFDLILSRYALERLLYRMSVSQYGERFLLKGALLFMVWGVDDHRPTRDADLLGLGDSQPDAVAEVFREICKVECEDGIALDAGSVEAAPIAEEKIYTGVRVTLWAELDKARIRVQVDIGFGDAVTPGPQDVDYPVLLDAPAPKLRAYPVETVIAEKLHAMTVLGMNNSRMKDFYDLKAIGARFAPDRETLAARSRRRSSAAGRICRRACRWRLGRSSQTMKENSASGPRSCGATGWTRKQTRWRTARPESPSWCGRHWQGPASRDNSRHGG